MNGVKIMKGTQPGRRKLLEEKFHTIAQGGDHALDFSPPPL